MSVKIKVSYQKEQELQIILQLLRPVIKSYKAADRQQGVYKRAYIEIKRARETSDKKEAIEPEV